VSDTAEALHMLAERVGIGRDYVDAWGQTQSIDDETLRALLGAIGLPARSDSEAARSLESLDDRSWGRALEPVTVTERGKPIAVNVTLCGTVACEIAEWRIRTEEDRILQGTIRLAARLPVEQRKDRLRRRLVLPEDLPLGYHVLDIRCGDETDTADLIVVPVRAYVPAPWGSTPACRDWAISAQLYSLRSNHNWGIGDFSDLATLAEHAARQGAAAIGVNPLHALFAADPTRVSPYSPSSRTFLNPLYIDVTAVPEFAECGEARDLTRSHGFELRLESARDAKFVDYAEVWGLKRAALELLYRAFLGRHSTADGQPSTERGRAFRRFQAEMGQPLERFAVYEALQEHFVAGGAGLAWRDWPPAYQDPTSDAVAAFARQHAERVGFSQYLQYEADRQLGRTARTMRTAGMSTALYRDIAVGVDPNGAEAWSDQSILVTDVSIGAPPDIHNPQGQDWGLTPFNTLTLKERAYAPFIAAVRANMRHAGAVRIDHILGLKRLWWVPRGAGPAAGAYIQFPLDDLIGIIALESERHRCFVVGEDLGTVPAGFREEMRRRRILSYRLLMFERDDDGTFLPPGAYPTLAAAAVSTHDLATLQGLWHGRDIEWRRELGLYPTEEHVQNDIGYRAATREGLLAALVAEGGLPTEIAALLRGHARSPADGTAWLAEAGHRYLACSPARFLLVQLEDLIGELEQMNLPGTVDEHPNWRRKLKVDVETMFAEERIQRLVRTIDEARREPLATEPETWDDA
jgi:4-alpha-glucanotransferase